ncbi:hypothetical protein ACQKWADRAFT_295690 [Trichoderma austrokoningii]
MCSINNSILLLGSIHRAEEAKSARIVVPIAPTSAHRKNLGVGFRNIFILFLFYFLASFSHKRQIGSSEAGFQRPSLSGGIVSRVSLSRPALHQLARHQKRCIASLLFKMRC